jgi:glutamate-ammonia-ligase adenylyltransferase
MQSRALQKILSAAANPTRAEHFFDQLKTTEAAPNLKTISEEQARILAALFSGSQALSEWLIAHPDWLALLDPEEIKSARHEQGLRREVNAWLKSALTARDYSDGFREIREFKQREMLRIGARDLARLAKVTEITRELSTIADISLDTVFQICFAQLTERFGAPYHRDANDLWQPTPFCVLGMGKLGGQELNYSSDVDVLFVYEEEGHIFKTPPRKTDEPKKGMSNHQFFVRLSEMFIAEVSRMTPEGMLFRIDLRLRPEGNSGPLARSLSSYENYYAQWGQTWERMMLIKARGVAGDNQLTAEFLEMIQPFRFPRSLNERVLREIAAVKQRIETEVVKSGELDRNVKLGRGGIREIEFVVQTLQILHAGKIPFLQSAQTIPTLQKLVQYDLLAQTDADDLSAAYFFLRDVEHRLQMENNQQTHTIPTERKARERLAALMGFDSLDAFEKAHKKHAENVRRNYNKLLKAEEASGKSLLPEAFSGNEDAWKKLLANHGFRDPGQAFRLLQMFVEGPGYVHVSPRTAELARELLPKFFALCVPQNAVDQKSKTKNQNFLSDPDRVLARLDSFISAYGTRALLYELWTTNPSLFQLLIWLFDRSEFLAEIAIRTPDLVDELELSGRLRRSKTAEETLRDLHHGLGDEDQHLWIRKYHQAELMRIGLRDILGLADYEQNLIELSALADACLQYALDVVLRKNKISKLPFVIIGMGKLGGSEINYGSDLDIIFVADSKTKNLPSLQKLAVELMDLLSAQTEAGTTFQTDARLRPDGEKGLLVNTLDAYEDYYRNRAQLWEIQSLTRIRPIAGDEKVGKQFQELAATLTDFRAKKRADELHSAEGVAGSRASKKNNAPAESNSAALSAFTPEWKKEVARMRMRIERERTPAGKDPLAIKTGSGGLIDAEFIAQTLCLENGFVEPNTLRALELGLEKGALEKSDGKILIENYRELRRIEGILRRWSYAGETLLPDDPEPLYRVAVRCGFKTSDEFMDAVKKFRMAIRGVYQKVFQR